MLTRHVPLLLVAAGLGAAAHAVPGANLPPLPHAAKPLLEVQINPESRVKVTAPEGPVQLEGAGWHPFRLRIHNEAGVTAPLRLTAVEPGMAAGVEWTTAPGRVSEMPLSGSEQEDRTVWFRGEVSQARALTLRFDVGQGTEDLGFRAETDLLFVSAGAGSQPPAAQPLLVQASRIDQALETLGERLPERTREVLRQARSAGDEAAVRQVQAALDPLCLAEVRVHPDGRTEATRGAAAPLLHEQGWRTYLVKILNLAGATGTLRVSSPAALPVPNGPAGDVNARWLDLHVPEARPLSPTLSGLALEYRLLQVYSRDEGAHTARLAFNVGGLPERGLSGMVREWRFPRDAGQWRAQNHARLETREDSLRVHSEDADPYFVTDVTAAGRRLVLRFRARAARDGFGQLFWWTDDQPRPSGAAVRYFTYQGGDQFRDYRIPFSVQGTLRGLRLDTPGAPAHVDFESISLSYDDEPAPQSAELEIPFRAEPSQVVTLRVKDEDGKPTTAAFEVRDAQGRVYPSQSKRLAPDFFFHTQVYRHDGETLRLPAGTYTVRCSRGPESLPETLTLEVKDRPTLLSYRVRRWIDPMERGWVSGDHHIHAAGCAHYTNPTEGVLPEHMARHILGEDLKVGANLTWGPCFDYQKQFFTGKTDDQSRYPYLLRYDIEVSGFGSHQSGHLCLLRLKEQMYPGGTSKDHWPTLGLNTLRWAKSQGAVTGPAHSANGLAPSTERMDVPDGPQGLPNYAIPAYNGIGANEFIVDITHQVPGPDGKPVPAVDFISAMDTDPRAELNMWYHALNCGFRTRVSGETDFPCISGERVGLGRVYVYQSGRYTYDSWCESIRQGRSYVSDGRHHLMDFNAAAGSARASLASGKSDLRIPAGRATTFSVRAAAWSRDGGEVPVELIVNGYPAGRHLLPRDGKQRVLKWDLKLDGSSWVAVRAFPGAHTNPIWVTVGDQPFRPDRRSVEWALRGVEQCWRQKERTYAPGEKTAAIQAYDHARATYRRLLAD